MCDQCPEIYLVSSSDNEWIRRFQVAVRDRYALRVVGPDTSFHGETSRLPAKGVVVFYSDTVDPRHSGWFERIRRCVHYMDLPLIAVLPAMTPTRRAQLLTAGASTVCCAEDEPEAVLKEVENRCNLEPVMEEIRNQLLDPFVEATVRTLGEMTGEKPLVHSVYQKQGYRIFGDHSAIIGLSARSEGTLVLSFPKETSWELSRRLVHALDVEVNDEIVQSCVGEITNIIVGQAKGTLSQTSHHFAMSTPTVVAGENHEIRYKGGLPCLVASFTSVMGDFALQLCMWSTTFATSASGRRCTTSTSPGPTRKWTASSSAACSSPSTN
jgi:CheY-specific phosphatase CheX